MAMFSVSEAGSAAIGSTWKKTFTLSASETQTELVSNHDGDSQFPERLDSSIQCTRQKKKQEVEDPTRLLQFLKYAIPLTKTEIEKSENSRARWSGLTHLWESGESKAERLRCITSSHLHTLQDRDESRSKLKYNVSCVVWNCSASMLVVAYGVANHSEWCGHESYALFWNLYKSIQVDSKPSIVLDIEAGCVSALAAHPRSASVFAIGTASGKVLIINCRYTGSGAGGENYIRATNASNIAHQDVVSSIHWVPGDKKLDQVVSLGLDGRIFLWKMNTENKTALTLVSAFTIVVGDLPRSLGIKAHAPGRESGVGIVAACFSHEDPNTFLVGCHGGALFQCTLTSRSEAAIQPASELLDSTHQRLSYLSPLVVSYVPHRAHVLSVQFSRSLRNVFLSAAADSELRIYSLLSTKPLSVVHSQSALISASWSLTRSACVYALQEDGLLAGYCWKDNKLPARPTFVLSVRSAEESVGQEKPLGLALNLAERNEQVAVSTSRGETTLWDLSRLFPSSFDQ